MPSIFGVLNGLLYSIMNLFNAQLSQLYGNSAASVMIHGVGLICLLPLCFKWGRPKGKAPWYMYLGGFIGVSVVLCTNVGISALGITANLSLALLGQILLSALVDQNGWFGATKIPMDKEKALSMAVIALGTGIMMFWPEEGGLRSGQAIQGVILAVVFSIVSGFGIITARIANAHLSIKAGVGFSTIMNYVTGLIGSLIVMAAIGFPMLTPFPAPNASITIYLGGALGMVSVIINNIITPKLPTVRQTLLVFVGQIFSGILLDAWLLGIFSPGQLVGGLMVAVGLMLNVHSDIRRAKAAK